MARLPAEGPDGGANMLETALRLVGVLRRRWLLVLAVVVVVIGSGLFVVSGMRPYWAAMSTVVVNSTSTRVLDTVQGVNEQDLWSPQQIWEYTGTQKEIIKSRTVAEQALSRLAISRDPTFLGTDEIDDAAAREAAEAAIDPVERLRSLISVGNIRDSRVVWISVEYPDPEMAKTITNTVTESYLEVVNSSRTWKGAQAEDSLFSEREAAREALVDAEKKLDAFKAENAITTISLADRQSLITQNIVTLSRKAKEAQTTRIELESRYAQAKKLKAAGNLASAGFLPSTERLAFDKLVSDRYEAEQEFARAKTRYGERMPEYKRAQERLTTIETRITKASTELLAALRARRDAARTTEARLQDALEAENQHALALGRLEPEYRELERGANAAEEAFLVVARRRNEVEITNRVEAEAPIEILDLATTPGTPVRPRKIRILMATMLGGILLGMGLAAAVDLRDQRIRTVGDLERAVSAVGLQVLGQLPLLPPDPLLGVGNVKAQRRRRDLFTHFQPQSQMAERCRGIRTSLTFALPSQESVVLLMTSPGSGDGKSASAMNLALSYCQAKKRVILVDADMRRPRIHHVFPPPPDRADVGIAAVLAGRVGLQEAVQSGLEEGPTELDVLTCGAIPANPAELLDGALMVKLLAELRDAYDVVIIDSPPVLPVTDPLILAPQVDGVVLVTRCDSTTQGEVRQALALLRQGDSNLLGAILNQVTPRAEGHGYRYGYKSAYYRTYGAHDTSVESA